MLDKAVFVRLEDWRGKTVVLNWNAVAMIEPVEGDEREAKTVAHLLDGGVLWLKDDLDTLWGWIEELRAG